MKQAEAYRRGYADGLRAFAWWKDGVQYVGSCGTTLEQALKEVPSLDETGLGGKDSHGNIDEQGAEGTGIS